MGSSDLELPLPEFLDAVARETPAPGGGSVSAVAAALAASLVEMSARFSHDWDGAQDAVRASTLLRQHLLRLAAEDAQAYAAYLAAPENERPAALEHATEVPANVASSASDVRALAEVAQRHGNPNLAGDLLVAIGLATAAEVGATRLVEINRKKGG